MKIGRLCLGIALLAGAMCSVAFAGHDTLWTRHLRGAGNGPDVVRALASDSTGNVYVAVQGSTVSGSEITTAKYSPEGNLLWDRRFSGTGVCSPSGIATGLSGDVFVAGTCSLAGGYHDIVTIKYSASGDSCWTQYFDADQDDDFASGVMTDAAGNAYVFGTSATEDGNHDCALIKYSASGISQWVRLLDINEGSNDSLSAAVIDPAGWVYGVGYSDNYWVAVKYSLDGTFQWYRTGSVAGANQLLCCALDPQANLLCAGTAVFGADSAGFLAVKYTPSGGLPWTRLIVADNFYGTQDNVAVAVGTDPLSNVVVAGTMRDTFLTVKYASDGTETWRRYRGEYGHGDPVCGMVLDANGDVYVAGDTRDGLASVKYSASGDSLWVRIWSAYLAERTHTTVLMRLRGGICVGGSYYLNADLVECAAMTVSYDDDGLLQTANVLNNSPGTGGGFGAVVTIDGNGNVIAAGTLDITGEYDDIAVVKYTPTGDTLWLRTYRGYTGLDDEADAVQTDAAGNVYVMGHSRGQGTDWDYVTIKYDPAGNLQWARRYDGPAHADDEPMGMVVDRFGNVFVTGHSDGGTTGPDYATVKYSATGQELWVRRYSGTADSLSDWPYAVIADTSGAAYVTGGVTGAGTSSPAVTIKYDAGGNQCWVNICEDPDTTYSQQWFGGQAITLAPSGGAFVAGTATHAWGIERIDSAGNTAWMRRTTGPDIGFLRATAFDPSGRAFLAGGIDNSLTIAYDSGGNERWRFCPGPERVQQLALGPYGTLFLVSRIASRLYEIVSLDSLGLARWCDTLTRSPSIAVASSGQLAIAGGMPGGSFCVMLYAPILGVCESPGYGHHEQQFLLTAEPNPFGSVVRLEVRVPRAGPVSIGIYDRAGRLVRSIASRGQTAGQFECRWDGTDEFGLEVGAGVYFVWAVVSGGADDKVSRLETTMKILKVR